MRKLLFLLLSVAVFAGCGNNKPSETIVLKNDVEIAGNASNSFSLVGDIRILVVPNVENESSWMIHAAAPIQKIDDIQIDGMTIDMDLLDVNGIKVREGFVLSAENLAAAIPVFNAASYTEKNIVFSAGEGMKKDFSDKEAAALLKNVKKVLMTINTTTPDKAVEEPEMTVEENEPEEVIEEKIAPEAPAVKKAEPKEQKAEKKAVTKAETKTEVKTEVKPEEKKEITLNSLLTDYGIYGMLSQYEKHLKNGEKAKAKQVEDKMWEIEKKVKKDPSIPKDLRDRFVDYIEDKEDEIEARY